eukprot:1161993-Pelagomonas_calceolata.AAC.1
MDPALPYVRPSLQDAGVCTACRMVTSCKHVRPSLQDAGPVFRMQPRGAKLTAGASRSSCRGAYFLLASSGLPCMCTANEGAHSSRHSALRYHQCSQLSCTQPGHTRVTQCYSKAHS